MRFLCVMDPLEKLDPEWDNSLAVLEELARRGHETWAVDVPDLWEVKNSVWGACTRFRWKKPSKTGSFPTPSQSPRNFQLNQFDLILIRKEPPFNEAYLHLTYLLEKTASEVPVINHPRGIRNTNEKLGILNFPHWIPETMVSASPERILDFQNKLGVPVIVKPLDQKGGRGVFLLPKERRAGLKKLVRATLHGKKTLMAQRFIDAEKKVEKRIILLNGKLLTLYEKKPRPREFRANLGLGGTFHPAEASTQEKKLIRDLRPYLLQEGLSFVGIDVLNDKLIEINVTCPAGVTEAKFLYPALGLLEAWASFLEDFQRQSVRLR